MEAKPNNLITLFFQITFSTCALILFLLHSSSSHHIHLHQTREMFQTKNFLQYYSEQNPFSTLGGASFFVTGVPSFSESLKEFSEDSVFNADKCFFILYENII